MKTASSSGNERILVQASEITDIHPALRAADIVVPRRSQGRTSEHEEIYSIVRVLATRPYALDNFPLKLIKRERPDFVLALGDALIGIEHTQAISQNRAKEAALRDGGVGPEAYFLKPESLDEPIKSSKQLRIEIEADEMGGGWYGDSIERSWAEAMNHFINKKVVSVQRPGYEKFQETWLVIYDQWTAPMLTLNKAIPALREKFDASPPWAFFSRILILDEAVLIDLDTSSAQLYCINHCT